MKQLKTNYISKIKIFKNNKNLIKKNYKLKILKLKYNNVKSNITFYLDNLENFQQNLTNLGQNPESYIKFLSDELNDSFFDSRYTQFTSYLSAIELINYTYIKGRFIYKYKYSLISFFIPFLIKNGKKLFIINNTLSSLSNIYNNLKYNNTDNFSDFLYVNQFKHFINSFKTNYNINYLLDWIITIYKPVFDLKCLNVPKIHKKKNNKKMIFKYVYLADKNRLKTANKHINLMIKKDTNNKIENRITNTFLDLLLNYKKSYLYTRKMFIYERVMDL